MVVNHYDTWKFGELVYFDEIVKDFVQALFFKNTMKIDIENVVNSGYEKAMNYMDGLYSFGKTVRSVQKKTMVNVAMIAGLYGGGGHANASGFTSTSQSFTNFLSLIEEQP